MPSASGAVAQVMADRTSVSGKGRQKIEDSLIENPNVWIPHASQRRAPHMEACMEGPVGFEPTTPGLKRSA